jgi:ribulose kinase
MSSLPGLFLGVDVGTGSVRAALFTEEGRRVGGVARKHIKKWTNPGYPDGSFEQSTEDIWQALCAAVKVVW